MRIILPLIAGYLAYRYMKKYSKEKPRRGASGAAKRGETGKGKGEDTVFDEVCQTYVPRSFAVKGEKEGKTYFFCSENCREKFKELAGR